MTMDVCEGRDTRARRALRSRRWTRWGELLLSAAQLLGDAITRVHTGQSIGELLTSLETAGGAEAGSVVAPV
jgi:hypothetical protein